MTEWTMTATLTRCPIVSPRPRSGRTPTSSSRRRSRAFNRNRAPRQTLHSRSATDRLTSPSVKAAMIAAALRLGKIVRAIVFRIEGRDRIARSKIGTRVTATIDINATIVLGISGPIAILSRRVTRGQIRGRLQAFRLSSRARDPITRIPMRASPCPRRWRPRLRSRRRSLFRQSWSRPRKETRFQPGVVVVGCGRHTALAAPIQATENSRTSLKKPPTTRPSGNSSRRAGETSVTAGRLADNDWSGGRRAVERVSRRLQFRGRWRWNGRQGYAFRPR